MSRSIDGVRCKKQGLSASSLSKCTSGTAAAFSPHAVLRSSTCLRCVPCSVRDGSLGFLTFLPFISNCRTRHLTKAVAAVRRGNGQHGTRKRIAAWRSSSGKQLIGGISRNARFRTGHHHHLARKHLGVFVNGLPFPQVRSIITMGFPFSSSTYGRSPLLLYINTVVARGLFSRVRDKMIDTKKMVESSSSTSTADIAGPSRYNLVESGPKGGLFQTL